MPRAALFLVACNYPQFLPHPFRSAPVSHMPRSHALPPSPAHNSSPEPARCLTPHHSSRVRGSLVSTLLKNAPITSCLSLAPPRVPHLLPHSTSLQRGQLLPDPLLLTTSPFGKAQAPPLGSPSTSSISSVPGIATPLLASQDLESPGPNHPPWQRLPTAPANPSRPRPSRYNTPSSLRPRPPLLHTPRPP